LLTNSEEQETEEVVPEVTVEQVEDQETPLIRVQTKKEREKALKKRDKAAKKIVGVSEAVPSGSKKLALSRELGIDTKSNANEQKEVPGTPIDAPASQRTLAREIEAKKASEDDGVVFNDDDFDCDELLHIPETKDTKDVSLLIIEKLQKLEEERRKVATRTKR